MTSAKPHTICNELLGQLEVLFQSDDPPSEFEMARLARDANKLLAVDAAGGYTVKAALAALRWDVDSVRLNSDRAVSIDGSTDTRSNAAINLQHVNLFDEAIVQAQVAMRIAPADKSLIEQAVDYMVTAGKFSEGAAVVDDAAARGIVIPSDAPNLHATVLAIGIDPDRLVFEMRAAHSVLFQHRVRPRFMKADGVADPDGGKTLVVHIGFHGTEDDQLQLECELAQLLAAEPGWDPSRLSIELSPVGTHAVEPA